MLGGVQERPAALRGGVPQRVVRTGRRPGPGPYLQRPAHVRRPRVERVRHVRQQYGQRLLGPQGHRGAGPRGTDELQRAVRVDPQALEERQRRWQVPRRQPLLGRGQFEQLAPCGGAALRRTVAVTRGVARRRRRTAQGVVPAAGVRDQRGQHPTLVGQQQPPRAEVGVPLHLHRVGDVQPLPRAALDEQQQVRARGACRVGEPQLGATGQRFVRVVAARHRLGPHQSVRRGHLRHRGRALTALCPGMVPGAVRRPCRHHGAPPISVVRQKLGGSGFRPIARVLRPRYRPLTGRGRCW